MGFSDGRPVSIGIHGKLGSRNAPTILNAAFNKTQFWDGRAEDLEAQVSGPMLNSLEMGHTLEGVERGVLGNSELKVLVEKAFGPGRPTMEKITKAIASFERTLVSGNSPFDRFFYGKDQTALSAAGRRGLEVFRSPQKGNCAVCHTIQEQFALFTDHAFHNLGAGLNAEGELTDLGRFTQTGVETDKGAFRTPGLRNVAKTAPYMHDGSLKTLKEVVDFYVGGGSSNPFLDKKIKPLTHLTGQERSDLVAFLESLSGEVQK
jgi:cytochrome c peroxidase